MSIGKASKWHGYNTKHVITIITTKLLTIVFIWFWRKNYSYFAQLLADKKENTQQLGWTLRRCDDTMRYDTFYSLECSLLEFFSILQLNVVWIHYNRNRLNWNEHVQKSLFMTMVADAIKFDSSVKWMKHDGHCEIDHQMVVDGLQLKLYA